MNVLKNVDEGENPVDSHYKSLRCDLQLVKKESNEFKVSCSQKCVNKFKNLHNYTYDLTFQNVIFFINLVYHSYRLLTSICKILMHQPIVNMDWKLKRYLK